VKSIIRKVRERLLPFMGLLIGLVICGAVPAAAQTGFPPDRDDYNRSSLWAKDYRNLHVVVFVPDDRKLGINEDDV
jgi:hypothetical protein